MIAQNRLANNVNEPKYHGCLRYTLLITDWSLLIATLASNERISPAKPVPSFYRGRYNAHNPMTVHATVLNPSDNL